LEENLMAQYVSVRFYKLTAEADHKAFEQAFHSFAPALGVERVMLLRGLSPNMLGLAPSQFDYGSIHIYASLEEASYTVKTATDLLTADEVPTALKPFLEFWRTVHAAPLEENVVNGFELLSDKP
tara:strand:- start:673 stop:1047 length:375 start_codon:yes stop_codon:yes gene_type:complete